MSQSPANNHVATCPQCGAPVTLPDWADLALCPFCGSNLRREQPVRADAWGPLRREMEEDAPAISTVTEGQMSAAGSGPPPALPGDVSPATGRGCAAPVPTPTGPLAPSGGQAAAQELVLHSLSCPQCAGPLSVRAGRRILLCGHCGVRVLVSGGGGLSRWLFPQNLDRLQTLAAARKWLTDYPGISRRARDVPLTRAQLVHVPIWEHRALVAGWEFGTKLRTRYHLVGDEEGSERLDLALAEEPFEEPHLQERRFFQAACDLEALGATRPRFSGRELLLPLVAGEVDPSSTVMEPRGTATDIAERGRKLALEPASAAADPQSRMLILRESVSLLYYPLWLVDYQAGGRPYRIVVDAHDGGVNSATAPAKEGRLTPSLGVRIAALVAVAIFALWLGSVVDGARVPTVLAAVIVCVAAILLVLRSPQGGKVEYHEPFSS